MVVHRDRRRRRTRRRRPRRAHSEPDRRRACRSSDRGHRDGPVAGPHATRRQLRIRTRVPRRRRGPPESTVGRPRLQHRHRRRGQHRMETRRRAAGMGAPVAPAHLRARASTGGRRHDRGRVEEHGDPRTRARRPAPDRIRRRVRGGAPGRRSDRATHEVRRVPQSRPCARDLVPRVTDRVFRAPTADDDKPFDGDNYQPSAAPGNRLPHTWLTPSRSLYDELGPGIQPRRRDRRRLGRLASPRPRVDSASRSPRFRCRAKFRNDSSRRRSCSSDPTNTSRGGEPTTPIPNNSGRASPGAFVNQPSIDLERNAMPTNALALDVDGHRITGISNESGADDLP